MATGDQQDIVARLLAVLPPWFPAGATSVLNAVTAGGGWMLSEVYGLIEFARLQTRLSTATGGWIDLIAFDFFGRGLLRNASESDAAFVSRIKANLLQPAATQAAVSAAVVALTGRVPLIIAPWRPADCGAYGYGGLGYGGAGYYGSLAMGAQFFIVAYRPPGVGTSMDAAILSVIASTIPAGVTAWCELSN